MKVDLDRPTREALAQALGRYLRDEFEVEIGGMEAQLFLDFLADSLGPHFYNQALYDAQAHLRAKMEAMGDAVLELEKPARF